MTFNPGRSRQPAERGRKLAKVCFLCEYNEGRSAHLELRTRQALRQAGCHIEVISAGLSSGGGINALRREYLMSKGVPKSEIDRHKATIFGAAHADSDLVLVAELPMKQRLLALRPELSGRVMTVRGFIQGLDPANDLTDAAEAHIEDADGHNDREKMELYGELEGMIEPIVSRIAILASSAGA